MVMNYTEASTRESCRKCGYIPAEHRNVLLYVLLYVVKAHCDTLPAGKTQLPMRSVDMKPLLNYTALIDTEVRSDARLQ